MNRNSRDISAQKRAADQIHTPAFQDAVTELPNRHLLMEQLKRALLTHTRKHRQAALLFIDLDNFKTLNDTLGAFGSPFTLSGREYRSTPSTVVTLFGNRHKEVENLFKQTDLAMYQAKAAGRNTVRTFDQGMQAAVDSRVAIESDLREGLSLRPMLLYHQPVVQMDGRITGAEALVRWRHPERGMVSPGEFIGLAESTRLILSFGQWVLVTACAQLAVSARHPDTRHQTLAVNVSAHHCVEPEFVLQVLQTADRTGVDPRRLKQELTESLLATNIENLIFNHRDQRHPGAGADR